MAKGPRLKEKQWDPKLELELIERWQKDGVYAFRRDSGKPVFIIDTPPPYPSGTWHVGAVAHYAQIDMAARFQRMRGREVLFPFGLDKNGINMELAVERKYGKKLHKFDRQEFIDLCRKELQPVCDRLLTMAKRIGLSADFKDHYYETDSAEYRSISQAIFIDLFNRGLIYKALRPAFYCRDCGTTIAEADLEYEEKETLLTEIKFDLIDGRELRIATTRPELLAACRAIIVHPDDERYKDLHGSKARVPIYGNEVTVHAHHAAKPEFGTGAAMICSYGDTTDIALFRELRLEAVKAIDEAGRMTEVAEKYSGMKVEKAREAILSDLTSQGRIARQEKVLHKAPRCERSKTPIEFIPMEDWYLKQVNALPQLRAMADEMKFHPPRHRQLILNWINSVTIDWPISRRRYYHTEIPLWYCQSCGGIVVPPPGEYYRPWKEPPPVKECSKCGASQFKGEDMVFDTWVDSSNTNLVASLYGRDDGFFRNHFPPALRPQGRDIVRNWLYYTMLKSYYVTGKKPFHHVLIHGMGLDKHGRAMHKSLGNVIEPGPLIERHGADSFRFWAASETNPGEDFRISEEKIAGAKKFLSKLWNVARFISKFKEFPRPPQLEPTDRWILSELNALIMESTAACEDFNFFVPSNRCREFIWNLLAPHYIEMVKSRAYAGDPSALYTLNTTLRDLLRLLAPIIPFSTAKIWEEVFGGNVHADQFPLARDDIEESLRDLTHEIVNFNSQIWKDKKEKGLSLNAPYSGVDIPDVLRPLAKDLKEMHRLV